MICKYKDGRWYQVGKSTTSVICVTQLIVYFRQGQDGRLKYNIISSKK